MRYGDLDAMDHEAAETDSLFTLDYSIEKNDVSDFSPK